MSRSALITFQPPSVRIKPSPVYPVASVQGPTVNPSLSLAEVTPASVRARSFFGEPTVPIVGPDESVWSDAGAPLMDGPDRLPTITIAQEVYPNGLGVQFWYNGAIDLRRDDVRPDGYDSTGPNEGSTYHMFPTIDLAIGDVLRAFWTDANGNPHENEIVIGTDIGVAVSPSSIAASTAITSASTPSSSVTASAVSLGAALPTPSAVGSPSAKPSPSNTGYTGTLTEYPGGADIDQAWLNANNGGSLVLENVRFNGRVNVEVDNLTIRNFEIIGGNYGVYNGVFESSPTSGLLLENGELRLQSSSGVLLSNATIRRCYVHDQGVDAFKPFSNVLIEECYITDIGSVAGSHADGVQMVSGGNNTFRRNVFEMPYQSSYNNSICLILTSDLGNISNLTIEDNWINGGGYSVNIKAKTGRACPANVLIRNNRFGRDYQFGLFTFGSCGGGYVLEGNVWDDTGLPVG